MGELLIVFSIGFAASFFGSLIGGTMALISMSSLLAIGIPAGAALATMRFGTLGFHLGAVFEYFKAKKIDWSFVLPLCILSIVGSLIGSSLVVNIDEALLKKVMAGVIILFIPFLLINRDMGVERKAITQRRKYIGFLLYFFATIWASSFAIGIGIMMIYIYLYFFGFTLLETKGTERIPSLFLESITLGVFIFHGLVDFRLGIFFLGGAIIGGLFGAKATLKIGDRNLRYFLILAIVVLVVRFLFY